MKKFTVVLVSLLCLCSVLACGANFSAFDKYPSEYFEAAPATIFETSSKENKLEDNLYYVDGKVEKFDNYDGTDFLHFKTTENKTVFVVKFSLFTNNWDKLIEGDNVRLYMVYYNTGYDPMAGEGVYGIYLSSLTPKDVNEATVKSVDEVGSLYKELTASALKLEVGDFTLDFSGEYTFDTIKNRYSEDNGKEVIKLAVKVTNNGSTAIDVDVMDYLLYTFSGSDGESKLGSGYYFDDDLIYLNIRPGETKETYIHLLYSKEKSFNLRFRLKGITAAPVTGTLTIE